MEQWRLLNDLKLLRQHLKVRDGLTLVSLWTWWSQSVEGTQNAHLLEPQLQVFHETVDVGVHDLLNSGREKIIINDRYISKIILYIHR